MHIRKNMIANNTGFKCIYCKMDVKAIKGGGFRNHCPYCLYSLHVDLEVPGDRLSECKGLMVPVRAEINKKKGVRILHSCKSCNKQIFNRIADDDNWDLICELSRIPS